MSSSVDFVDTPQKKPSGCVGVIIGLILIAFGGYILFILNNPVYQSDNYVHSTQTQFAIKCVSLTFEEKQKSYTPTAILLLTDRRGNPNFDKFQQDFNKQNIFLVLQQEDGKTRTLRLSQEFGYSVNNNRPVIPTINETVVFEKIEWDSIKNASQMIIYFSDFPPMELRHTNPVLNRLPLLTFSYAPFILIGIGGLMTLILGLKFYDSQPIPNEYVPPPDDLELKSDEPWRKYTDFRYLENLKNELENYEEIVKNAHQKAVEAHQELPMAEGYITYKTLRAKISTGTQQVDYYLPKIEKEKEHIEMVFAGEVRSDLQKFEEKLEKLFRERQEYQASLNEIEIQISKAKDDNSARSLEFKREDLKSFIKSADMKIIEVESVLKELRDFNFLKLYKELGLSPEVMRARYKDLRKFKEKQQAADDFKPPSKEKSEAELKAEKLAELDAKIEKLVKEIGDILSNKNLAQEEKVQQVAIVEDMLHKLRKERLQYL
jgi:hypothetical protein